MSQLDARKYAVAKQLFLDCCDLPEAERTEFLQRTCSDDPELRTLVDSLLTNHRTHSLFYSQTSNFHHERTQPTRTTDAVAGSLFASFRRLGQYCFTSWSLALLVAAVTLGCGLMASIPLLSQLESCLRQEQTEALATVSISHRALIEEFLNRETVAVGHWVRDQTIETEVEAIVRRTNEVPGEQAERVKVASDHLRMRLLELAGPDVQYALWNREGTKVAARVVDDKTIGAGASETGGSVLARVFRGEAVVRLPHTLDTMTTNYVPETLEPQLAIVTPVYHPSGAIIGAILIRGIHAETRFYAQFDRITIGTTGHAYAVDRHGHRVSTSRLLRETHREGHPIPVVDPGGIGLSNSTGRSPQGDRLSTVAARHLMHGEDGLSAVPYRDERGVPVIGAWSWLPENGLGIVVERSDAEVIAPIQWLRKVQAAGFGICTAFGVGWIVVSLRMRSRAQKLGLLQIGPYRIDSVLGEGGMGRVFRAYHADLKRPTALKVLKQQDPQWIRRFVREVQTVSRLQHPNTIEIFDFGQTESGEPYYAMELIEGFDLFALGKTFGPQPPDRVITLMRQVCYSLREAHQAGLVHRDIKPQNIMVGCRGGIPDVVKVLDFGLVKEQDSATTTHTGTSHFLGTPRYMAPERLVNPRENDPRSDIYSLGAVCYYLLSGKEIFAGSSMLPGLEELLVNTPELSDTLPQGLIHFVNRCLAKLPSQRPQSMIDCLQSLDQLDGKTWTEAVAAIWWREQAPQFAVGLPPAAGHVETTSHGAV